MAGRNLSRHSSGGGIQPFGYDDPFSQIQREMTRLFSDLARSLGGPLAGDAEQAAQLVIPPRMDVRETDRDIEVIAELPGVNEADIEITLDDDTLTIRGETVAEISPQGQQGQGGQQGQPQQGDQQGQQPQLGQTQAEQARRQEQRRQHNYHLMERAVGVFQRQLRLPFRVDPSRVNATFQNGVLHVRIEKPARGQTQGNRIGINQPAQQGQQPANVIGMPQPGSQQAGQQAGQGQGQQPQGTQTGQSMQPGMQGSQGGQSTQGSGDQQQQPSQQQADQQQTGTSGS